MPKPYKPLPTRAERRAAAREAAKLLVDQVSPPTSRFRWDYTLAFVVAIMAVLLVFFPPQDIVTYCIWLAAMFGLGIYPTLHFAEWIRPHSKLILCLALLSLVVTVSVVGAYKWPPVKRHTLSQKEQARFENPLKAEKDDDLEIQLACSPNDEKGCTYATQFIFLIGDSGWKVQSVVDRLPLTRPMEGITIYRRGGDKAYMMQHYNAGGWFNDNEPHMLAMQKAFQSIHIELNGGTDPDLQDNVMMIYFGPERENEAERTDLTRTTEWATGKRLGPFPGKRNTRLCRWFGLVCD